MFVGVVCESAVEQGLPVHWSLPLVSPLPLNGRTMKPAVAAVYLELLPLVHLLVEVGEGLEDRYHLVSLTRTSFLTPVHPAIPQTSDTPLPPKSFFAVSSLVTLNVERLCLQHLKTVVGEHCHNDSLALKCYHQTIQLVECLDKAVLNMRGLL